MSASLYDRQGISREVLPCDEPRLIRASAQTADSEAAPLAERVPLEAAVLPDDDAVDRLDRTGTAGEPGSNECAERALTDETDAGRVALVSDRQAAIPGQRTNLGLAHAANRKLAIRKLRGVERVQEIALVFFCINSAQEAPAGSDARVMAGGEAFAAQAHCIFEAETELDLAIAEHVRIRRAAGLELGQEMREHALAVFG